MTIQDVDSEFQKRVLKDMRLMEIRSRIRHGTATFADTAEYNDRASTILGDLLSGQMPSTPDGERAKLCKYMLRHLYDDTNEMCTAVQQTLDKAQGLHLAPQKVPFPTERVQAIAGSLEDKTVPMETTQRRARSSATVGRSFHDDRMKAEADFRSRAGLKCYIVRNGGAKCCEWCAAMVGRYAYGEEPGDVYRRHDNCSCTVIYENGRQRQDVWSKRSWEAPAEGAGADALTVFTDETRPEGAVEAVRLTAEEARAAEAQHPVIAFSPEQAKSLQEAVLTNDTERDRIIIREPILARRERNIGAFSELEMPMQKRTITRICKLYGIDISELRFKIQRDPHFLELQDDYFGSTDYDDIGRIDLFPKAFTNEEQLVRTILHEKLHVLQLKKHGKEYSLQNLNEMEKQARKYENVMYTQLRKKVKR